MSSLPADITEASSPQISKARKLTLLALFCLAQFLDVFNNSALFAAIPTLRRKLGFDEGGATWLISAYQLTFASFLLIAGKIADVYNPSTLFQLFVEQPGNVNGGFRNLIRSWSFRAWIHLAWFGIPELANSVDSLASARGPRGRADYSVRAHSSGQRIPGTR
jgi:MFS family permease